MEPARRRLIALIATLLVAGLVGAGWWWARRPPTLSGLDVVPRLVPEGRRVVVEVLNAGGRQGGARHATRVLRRAGFDVVLYGTATERQDTTVVLVRRGEGPEADLLVRALGTGRVETAPDTLRRVDYTVLLGPEWRPPGFIP